MASDDFYVLVCKLLLYLYDCKKEGVKPDKSRLAPNTKMFPINEEYWHFIMVNVARHSWADGIITMDDVDNQGGCAILTNGIQITAEGIAFLHENSLMSKAISVLKETQEWAKIILRVIGG